MLGWIFLYVVAFHKICKSGQTLVDVVLIELKRLKVSSFFFFFFLRHLLEYSKDKMLYLLLQLEINRGLAWWGREGNGTPPQYSCLENPMDGGAWWAAVHVVAKSQTRLSDFTFTFHF